MSDAATIDRPRRAKGKRSMFAIAAEREALRERERQNDKRTIAEQARQISDLKRQLASSINKSRRQT